ncbi:hypothetical protein PAPYR_2570 [Paratrimastix pyriformis]|uniref:PSI domain-containing protein n=1 Tax=Paratrimastix pyriformis TaxID=342808 RepID=A0ABQ8UTQ2_9EUKA|nr:hypothetical protein PAPYR_2570 [Paratrimastix pyriformis]
MLFPLLWALLWCLSLAKDAANEENVEVCASPIPSSFSVAPHSYSSFLFSEVCPNLSGFPVKLEGFLKEHPISSISLHSDELQFISRWRRCFMVCFIFHKDFFNRSVSVELRIDPDVTINPVVVISNDATVPLKMTGNLVFSTTSCPKISKCEDCTDWLGCGYCLSSRKCLYGMLTGPKSGNCSLGSWGYYLEDCARISVPSPPPPMVPLEVIVGSALGGATLLSFAIFTLWYFCLRRGRGAPTQSPGSVPEVPTKDRSAPGAAAARPLVIIHGGPESEVGEPSSFLTGRN